MVKVLIRPLKKTDIEPIRLLLKSVDWEDQFLDEQEVNEGETCVAVMNDVVVGYIHFQHLKWKRLSYLHNLVVSADHRRLGIAKQLICHAEKTSQSKGNRGLYLDTPADNKGARVFYEAMGYKEDEAMKECYESGADGVIYLKLFE